MFISRAKLVMSGWAFSHSLFFLKSFNLSEGNFLDYFRRGKRYGFLVLAFNCAKCRRRKIDRIYFFFACILIYFSPFYSINS